METSDRSSYVRREDSQLLDEWLNAILLVLECNNLIIFFYSSVFAFGLLPVKDEEKIGQDLVLMFSIFLLDGGLRLNFGLSYKSRESCQIKNNYLQFFSWFLILFQ